MRKKGFELVELDSDGEEMEFIAEGWMIHLEQAREDLIEQADMVGAPWPNLRIQPLSR